MPGDDMSRNVMGPLIVVGLVAAAGWHFREPLKARLDAVLNRSGVTAAVSSATSPPPAPGVRETVYHWVDDNGVSHFDQRPHDGGEAVVIDTNRTQSMQRMDAPETSASGSPVVSLPPAPGRTGLVGTIPRVKDQLRQAGEQERRQQQNMP